MKKIIAILTVCVMVLAFAACEKEETHDGRTQMFTRDDTLVQIQTSDKFVTVERINDDGTIHIVRWSYTKKDGEYETYKQEQQYADVTVDENTEILMGKIFDVDDDTKLANYDKTTDLNYFLGNATKKFDGEPLYFNAKIVKGHVEKLELVWDMYFDD